MRIEGRHNFVELLCHRACEQSAKTAVTFLLDGEESCQSLTYGELDGRARSLAVQLLTEVPAGDRVLLLQPPGLEFVVSFFACFYAGVVAIPAYPPRNARHLPRIEGILQDAQARVILTSEEVRAKMKSWLGERAACFRVICSEAAGTAGAMAWQVPALKPDTLALLQYTSGSTGEPRGVMVTHGNIMANEEMIRRAFGHHNQSTVASWLPVYHDMGLIGNLFQPLYLGTHVVLMSPASFLQKPVRWLAAVSRFQARSTGAPNFALDLCTRTVTEGQKATLDLSCLDVLYSGSEPIDAQVLERFATAFRQCGLRREVLYPCYGMAEATLFCTGGRPGEGPHYLEVDADALASGRAEPASAATPRRLRLVSCGYSAADQQLVIVDPELRSVLRDGLVGEIWLRGPHVAAGYWRKEAQTRDLFHATLSTGGEPFLRTGDLGFLQAGELYVTGRRKDVLVIRGRNYYPQDVERAAESSHPALQPGACCAFALSEGGGGVARIGVAVEVRRSALRKLDGREVAAAIRRAVLETLELVVHVVALLKPLTLPKTSSGKLQRPVTREAFMTGMLDTLSVWRQPDLRACGGVGYALGPDLRRAEPGVVSAVVVQPPVPPAASRPAGKEPPASTTAELKGVGRGIAPLEVERWLCAWIGRRLAVTADRIDPSKPFADFGIDSVTAVELSAALAEWLQTPLPATVCWDFPNIRALAGSIVRSLSAVEAPPPAAASRDSPDLEGLSQTELAALLAAELKTLR